MKKDYMFYISCFLVVTSIVMFHVNQLFQAFGLIVLLISLILLFFARKRIWYKLIYFFVFLIISVIGFTSGAINLGHKAFDEYYISQSVNGNFRVMFTRDCGEIPIKDDNWYQLHINDCLQYYKRPKETIFSRKRFWTFNDFEEKTQLKEIKSIDEFDGTPSIIVYTPKYWKEKDINILDFRIIRNGEISLDNQDCIDELAEKFLLNCE